MNIDLTIAKDLADRPEVKSLVGRMQTDAKAFGATLEGLPDDKRAEILAAAGRLINDQSELLAVGWRHQLGKSAGDVQAQLRQHIRELHDSILAIYRNGGAGMVSAHAGKSAAPIVNLGPGAIQIELTLPADGLKVHVDQQPHDVEIVRDKDGKVIGARSS